LDYHPSPLARGLRDRRTNTVGLLFFWLRAPILPDYYQRELLAGVLDGCVSLNYQILINSFVGELDDVEDAKYRCRRFVKDPRTEGLLVVNPPEILLDVFHKESRRIVLINRQDKDLSYVDGDQVSAVVKVVDYLLAKGHRRIGLIAGNPTLDGSDGPRREGYRIALEAHGIAFDPALVWSGSYSEASGREGARHLLALANAPTALVTVSDRVALGALDSVRQLSPARPVAVTGFDDIPEAAFEGNALTTVRQPIYDLGRNAAEILISSSGAEAPSLQQRLMPMELILRKSA